MKRMLFSLTVLAGFSVFLAAMGGIAAPPGRAPVGEEEAGSELPIEEMAEDADIIFEGVISKIEQRVVGQKENALPFTYVTYDVKNVLKGKGVADSLTLRFVGGSTEPGRYLHISNTPSFEVGDHDIMFVKGNTKRAVPLVGGTENARFRMIEESVFTNSGVEILEAERGKFAKGEQTRPELGKMRFRPGKEEIEQIKAKLAKGGLSREQEQRAKEFIEKGVAVGRKRGKGKPTEQDTAKGREDKEVTRGKGRARQAKSESFAKAIAQAARRKPGKPEEFQNADPGKPITIKGPSPDRAPRMRPADEPKPPQNETAEEKAEREELEKNKGNPVLKKE